MTGPVFRRDLYQGTAGYYDRFRLPYPRALTDDLAHRSGADGTGRLLDLACGTGQVCFALHDRFAEAWAVDQEAEMIAVVRDKARVAGLPHVRALAAPAEGLSAPDASFDLVTIGNAFHRLPRDAVAARVFRWLRPGGFLALVWSSPPWDGQQPWQRALARTMDRWRARADASDRIPAGYEQDRRERPDVVILAEAGFEIAGRYRFPAVHEWTPETLTGFVLSTSVLSPAALGGLTAGFGDDLRRELHVCAPSGRLPQAIDYAYDLARRPG
jgi:ubiquinone/menaquinone biosynthesis C-methylase UbiE